MVNTRWMLRYIFQTQNEATFPHQAPIEAGIDAMVTSLTEPGDRIVIAISGAYGQRLHTISSRYGKHQTEEKIKWHFLLIIRFEYCEVGK